MTPAESVRARQRAATERRIEAAARARFAARGYDGTTIRSIAAEADTDPALVIRYFDSKAKLFRLVADPTLGASDTTSPDPFAQAVAGLADKLERRPDALLAGLHALLSGAPDAATPLAEMIRVEQRALADAIDADNPLARAGLIGAVTVGAVLARHVLPLDGVRAAPGDDLMRLLTPCLRHLASRTDTTDDQGQPRPRRPRPSGNPPAERDPRPSAPRSAARPSARHARL